MKRKAKIAIFCALICLLCGCTDSANSPVQKIDTAMGTIISQTLYPAENKVEEAEQSTQEILWIIRELEKNVLSHRILESDIGKVNRSAGSGELVSVSDTLQQVLEICQMISKASNGAFDVTLGEVVGLWDIDRWAGEEDVSSYQIPKEEQIKEKLQKSGYQKLQFTDGCIQVPEGMQLDLGAVGKGIALDEIRNYLEQQNRISGAVISVGGSILTYGEKETGVPWKVAVVNPLDTSKSLGYLSLTGTRCVSTSGNYERYVEKDGVRYHHIINPYTGYPVDNEITGVTILSDNGLLSDALSTACYVLGVEEGMELAERYDAEALFVDKEGNLYMTEGMEEVFHR